MNALPLLQIENLRVGYQGYDVVRGASLQLGINECLVIAGESGSGKPQTSRAIARSLVPRPRVLLLDEPSSALDASVQAEALNLLAQVRLERRLSLVMVSHLCKPW